MATQRKPPPVPNDVIVFGLDETGRPHAARFPGGVASMAVKAADSLKYRVIKVDSEAEKAVARKLPTGKILAAGKGTVPIARKDLFAQVLALLPVASQSEIGQPRQGPATWSEIAVGDLVLAEDPIPNEGWYEAVVLEAVEGDQFKLRFRDYPEEGIVVRSRQQLALLPPA